MNKERKDKPTSIRFGEREREIIKRIIKLYSRPGLPVGLGGAVKIALHYWDADNQPEETVKKGENGK